MTALELRSRLHTLIDQLKNEELLQRLYDLLAHAGERADKGVWGELGEAERERVLKAYSTAMEADNLSTTDAVMKRRKA